MKILFFGSYNPEYSRNRVLLKGLRANGVQIIECNVRAQGWLKLIRLIGQYIKIKDNYDVMLLPFPGQEIMLLARILTRKPIIFDAFTSHYEGYILDRKKYSPNSFQARWYHWLDSISCRLADLVLLDTQTHIDYFVSEFGIPQEKFLRVFVGTDTGLFKPSQNKSQEFIVHFHGHFIPLQGVEYIVKAAELLKDEPIQFRIIGQGQTYSEVRKLSDSLAVKNIDFIDSVSYDMLPEYLNKADICLGIFGSTPKAHRVIPNKVFEALACGRAVITADTPAARELLIQEENAELCQPANAVSLADSIVKLKNNSELRQKIAENAGRMFADKLSEKKLAAGILSRIEQML